MMNGILKKLVVVGDPLLFGGGGYMLTLFCLRKINMGGMTFDVVFEMSIGVIVLTCISYHDVWGIIAQRNRSAFLKPFIWLNLLPLCIGLLTALLRLSVR